jgi:hypothetical protein
MIQNVLCMVRSVTSERASERDSRGRCRTCQMKACHEDADREPAAGWQGDRTYATHTTRMVRCAWLVRSTVVHSTAGPRSTYCVRPSLQRAGADR